MRTGLHTGRFIDMAQAVLDPLATQFRSTLRFADLFCGIGGFHVAARNLGLDAVFACDIDEETRRAYRANFELDPVGDIVEVRESKVPDHDLLFAGFPCQPFSIIGRKEGFADPRGTLFFEVLRIIRAKRPQGIILENVKQMATADRGRVLARIMSDLEEMDYRVDYRVLNALDFGLPQKRERTIIVATLSRDDFQWPSRPVPMTPLADVLEAFPDRKHYVSEQIRTKRHARHSADFSPAIWHENKAGNVSSHPWSCALRAGASYNYLLVDGERRLTPRELLRLQGFPDSWEIVCNDAQTRKQAGNAVPVPMVQAVVEGLVAIVERAEIARRRRWG